MALTQELKPSELPQEQLDNWFEQFIHGIKVDKLALETATASKDKTELYMNAITGNVRGMMKDMRFLSSQYFIQQITIAFINEIVNRGVKPQKLAFSLSPSTILVWSEINDDDQNVQDQLILAEAKVNSEFKETLFSLDIMIVEESDKIKVPRHYIPLKNIIGK